MSGRLRIPVSTYRFQFNVGFGFRDAEILLDYLKALGITDIYASPILKARKGSSHGYDVTDPTCLNPELGTEDDFNTLAEGLYRRNMGLILDIVPNHMAASPENPWWQDATKEGADASAGDFFDFNWLDFDGSSTEKTNCRRFFDIGDLVGVRVEDPRVFEIMHSYIFELIDAGTVTGLRLDHIDGLYDPLEYLMRLQYRVAPDRNEIPGFYVVVEKILSGDETIPEAWPVYGTTGYEFAGVLNSLFVNKDGMERLAEIYARNTGQEKNFRELVYEKKKQVMQELFADEMNALKYYIDRLSGQPAGGETGRALEEVTACLPVYRTYTRNMEVTARDREYIENAVLEATHYGNISDEALNSVKKVLLLDFPEDFSDESKSEWLTLVLRWQQITPAIMAKGSEDTALYNYHKLISCNEVGGEPDKCGLSVAEFHQWNRARAERWPQTMNTTSTHDTKRSEDVRARINVLSEIPHEWQNRLDRWRKWNNRKKIKAGEFAVPEANTEMLLYQTLMGAWPLDAAEVPEFKNRLKEYMVKAAREAKAITSWIKINQEYEEDVLSFIEAILQDSADNEFLMDFLEFQEKIAYYGALNSLAQVLLKITLPGVPDFYQGTELWDFSLVDPDNRRPVDFRKRRNMLDYLLDNEKSGKPIIDDMLANWQDGRIKLYITCKALNVRQQHKELFKKGEYVPLKITGNNMDNIVAFTRCHEDKTALIAVPRFFTQLTDVDRPPCGKQVWGENRIHLPDGSPQKWWNVFTGETVSTGESIGLYELFDSFPLALFIPQA